MKKVIIVVLLFALPIVAYLFFASGVHNFAKLPVVNEKIGSLKSFRDMEGNQIDFQDKITILGFYGNDINNVKGYALNLNQKIYDRYYQFIDFQVVIVVPAGVQEDIVELKTQLDDISDVSKWKFVFGEPDDIKLLFDSLGTKTELNNNLASPYVFIIDKDGKLRGRDDKEYDEPIGYNAGSVAELSDKMNDDVKVILAEYRLELKKYKGENKKLDQ
ncbi:MAG TPA: hypothetical protein VFM70_05140 [Salinimicrobium sp.]|nr:hypothetical protein [Salinimicrobium sp.]